MSGVSEDYLQLLRCIIVESWKENKPHDVQTLRKVIFNTFSFILEGKLAPEFLDETSPFYRLSDKIIYCSLNYPPYIDNDDRIIFSGAKVKNFSADVTVNINKLTDVPHYSESQKYLPNTARYFWLNDKYHLVSEKVRVNYPNTWHQRSVQSIKIQHNESEGQCSLTYFLMHLCGKPRTIGFSWSPEYKEHNLSNKYIDVPFSYHDDENLDLFSVSKKSLNEYLRMENFTCNQESLNKIKLLWESCTPINDKWLSMYNVEQALKVQCWESFFWSGKAVISIPYTVGQDAPGYTGVLTLCTTEPLSDYEIDLWHLVSSTIFSNIFFLESSYRYAAHLNIVNRIGHPVKNRSGAVAAHANKARRRAQKLLKERDLYDEVDLDAALKSIERILDVTIKLSKRLTGFGDMANMMASIQNTLSMNQLWSTVKDKFLSKKSLKLKNLLKNIESAEIHYENPNASIRFYVADEIGDFTFIPYIDLEGEKYNLHEILYHEIFSEISNNALKYSTTKNNIARVDVLIVKIKDKKFLCFQNRTLPRSSSYQSLLNQLLNVRIEGAGGEALVAYLLERMLDGTQIYKRYLEDDEQNVYHQYLIDLSNIRYSLKG